MNAWQIHQHEEIFGARCNEFRPERWLPEESGKDQLQRMERFMFSVGLDSSSLWPSCGHSLAVETKPPDTLFSFLLPDAVWSGLKDLHRQESVTPGDAISAASSVLTLQIQRAGRYTFVVQGFLGELRLRRPDGGRVTRETNTLLV